MEHESHMRHGHNGGISRLWDTCTPKLRAEARRLMAAMTPRCPVWWLMADRDRTARAVPIGDLLPDLRRQIHAITGGDTLLTDMPRSRLPMLAGDGRYCAPNGVTMQENTLVLLICLPPTMNDKQRHQLLELFIDYGLTINQEVVQIIAGITTCWLPTGELIDALAARQAMQKEVQLASGLSARTMNGRGGTMQVEIQKSNNPNGARLKPGPGGRDEALRHNGGTT